MTLEGLPFSSCCFGMRSVVSAGICEAHSGESGREQLHEGKIGRSMGELDWLSSGSDAAVGAIARGGALRSMRLFTTDVAPALTQVA